MIVTPPDMRTELLNQYEALLHRVNTDLEEVAPRPCNRQTHSCASCFTCCTARGPAIHRVTEIEYALLEDRVGQHQSAEFRDYLNKKPDESGNLIHETCPNYDHTARGCGVYNHRPFACRVFGHLKPEGTFFPSGCHFNGHETTFSQHEYFEAVPGAVEVRHLNREFQMLLMPEAGQYCEPAALSRRANMSNLREQDPLDAAVLLQAEGRCQEALNLLLETRQATGPSLHLDWCLAILLSRTEQHEPALAVYSSLLQRLPQRWDLYYYAGFHALMLGHKELALEHLKVTVEHIPDHSLALGLLGYLALQANHWEDAEFFFGRSSHYDPYNPYPQLRLGLIKGRLSKIEEARIHLEAASRHEGTQAAALQALEELKAA